MVANIQPLTEQETALIGKLIVQALGRGSVDETARELRELPMDIEAVPQPFRDLIKMSAGSASIGRELTLTVVTEVYGICQEILGIPPVPHIEE